MPIRHEPILMIDSALIAQNIREVRLNTSKQIIGVLKCEGYGLGLERAHRILNRLGVNFFAVATTDEALRLRSITPDTILLLTPVFDIESVEQLTKANIIQTIAHESQYNVYRQATAKLAIKPDVHISIDTGLGRYGFRNNELPSVAKWSSVCTMCGCFAHFNGKLKTLKKQMGRFQRAVTSLHSGNHRDLMTHFSNSSALFQCGDGGFDAVRIGSAWIGRVCRNASRLQSAVRLEAPVTLIKEYPAGSTIGYQETVRLHSDRRLGLVQVGHATGLFVGPSFEDPAVIANCLRLLTRKLCRKRHLRHAIIHDERLPVIGQGSLFHTMIDVTGTSVEVGDTAAFDLNPLFVPPHILRKECRA